MNKETDWVVVGRIGRPHGIKGFVTIHSFTEPRENILRYSNDYHLFLNDSWQPVNLLSVEIHTKAIIARIEGFPEREVVTQLTNAEIAVPKSRLPILDSGEYYWHELLGMSVVNHDGGSLGQVIEIMPTGSNDVLVVQGKKRYLIPYLLNQFIIGINAQEKLITVNWDVDF